MVNLVNVSRNCKYSYMVKEIIVVIFECLLFRCLTVSEQRDLEYLEVETSLLNYERTVLIHISFDLKNVTFAYLSIIA